MARKWREKTGSLGLMRFSTDMGLEHADLRV